MIDLKSNSLMGKNLRELQHQQWGSICGYANEIHLAVLKDEVEILKSRNEPHDREHRVRDASLFKIHTTISTLEQRIEEIEGNI